MPLSLFVFSQSGPPICTPIWAFFRAFKALRALNDQIFTYFNASAVSRYTIPEIFMSLPLSVLSQSGPPKSVGGGGGRPSGGGRGGGGVVYHTSTGQYIGVATFFFFFFFF